MANLFICIYIALDNYSHPKMLNTRATVYCIAQCMASLYQDSSQSFILIYSMKQLKIYDALFKN